jgi:hypothetical protein
MAHVPQRHTFSTAMEPQRFVQTCICNRSFDNPGAFTRHGRTCKKRKRQLGDALVRAKESYSKKRRHVESSGEAVPSPTDHSVSIAVSPQESQSIVSSGEQPGNRSHTQTSQVRSIWIAALLSTLMHHIR